MPPNLNVISEAIFAMTGCTELLDLAASTAINRHALTSLSGTGDGAKFVAQLRMPRLCMRPRARLIREPTRFERFD